MYINLNQSKRLTKKVDIPRKNFYFVYYKNNTSIIKKNIQFIKQYI